MTNRLDAKLLAAHASGDRSALVRLYTEAADSAPTEDAQAFFLTHAFVFALERGDPAASDLENRLRAMNRL